MQIAKIDPNEKYVLALPNASREYALIIAKALKELLKGDENVLVVFGTEVTIIPVDQVVGYTILEGNADG